MKEFVEKLISRLKEIAFERFDNMGMGGQMVVDFDSIVEIVNELVNERNKVDKWSDGYQVNDLVSKTKVVELIQKIGYSKDIHAIYNNLDNLIFKIVSLPTKLEE